MKYLFVIVWVAYLLATAAMCAYTMNYDLTLLLHQTINVDLLVGMLKHF